MKQFSIILLAILWLCSCANFDNKKAEDNSSKGKMNLILNNIDGSYWYQGKGEVNSYSLEQARYGQLHKGEAVLVFVTEDFSKSKQVKLDNVQAREADKQAVFKLNMMKRFNTGIYTYSLMLSVFTPIGQEVVAHPLKITSSMQDWCGQVFSQMNQRENKYVFHNYSYFESESDQVEEMNIGILEDEIWNQIRIDPKNLRVGLQNVLPGSFYVRLKHKPLQYLKANLSLSSLNDSIQQYQIEYVEDKRSLKIQFKSRYPFTIESWEESYMEGNEILITKASKFKTLLVDYWDKHNVEDSNYRDSLRLL